ncbi:GAP family protein [Mycolicibacterium pallens]|uniref:GAP family protein n=1 Tax=Mycolicibacterium pallens TaxID=370524 RepID=A0ABX8V9M6_9MYCO|nr:GAP family protein [Mycolicibacterium pallens]APE14977.1 hypothetical protein BOH72_06865 [Mycobacterium sp. WY10]QYL14507.1 GAP family protein [Mycolicibacterium pallens]
MWAIVMLLGLSVAADPLRIGITVILTSRPRPVLNLVAFWAGGMAVGLACALATLVLLKDIVPSLINKVVGSLADLTNGNTEVVLGAIALLVAVVGAVRLIRQPAYATKGVADQPDWTEQPVKSTAMAGLAVRARRMLQSGNPWVSFVVGLSQGPAPVEYLAAISIIHASGASISAQVGASIAFTVAMLAIVELLLLSYLLQPAKTQSIVTATYSWLQTYRRHILVFGAGALGIYLLATG